MQRPSASATTAYASAAGGKAWIHVLLDCPSLRYLRRELRGKVGDAFNSMTALLGGSEERGTASRAKTVEGDFEAARHEGSKTSNKGY